MVLLAAAKEQENTGNMLLDDRPYVQGRDGRWRATAAAQKLCLIKCDTHFIRKSTRRKRDRAAAEREVVQQLKRQKRAQFEERRANMEARHRKGKYCKCNKNDNREKMVMCSDCKEWYHAACLDKTEFIESKCRKGRWRCAVCCDLLAKK